MAQQPLVAAAVHCQEIAHDRAVDCGRAPEKTSPTAAVNRVGHAAARLGIFAGTSARSAILIRVHQLRLRVRYAECDMQGHVFNGHYLTWFDMAHTEALRARLGTYQSIVERGIELVVAEANVRYRLPAHFDDDLVVGAAFEPLRTTSMISDFEIHRSDALLAEGTLRHVCVDASTFVKRPWPDWVRAALPAP